MTTWTVATRSPDVPFRDLSAAMSGSMNYVLDRVVGEGGVGEVWSALQVSLNRVVAVKKFRSDRDVASMDPESNERRMLHQRFHDEAMLTAQLEHPNIVPVYDFGQDTDGTPLLAMKLVRGEPWDVLVRRDFDERSPEAFLARHLPIFVDMMQAVAFAHSRGVVHRDLKPSQVMVGEFGEVSLIDWGLAIVTDEGEVHDALSPRLDPTLPTPSTATNPSGTPALMAPEQTEDDARNVSTLTDIYLLGGTLYYLLAGHYPHEASTSTLSMQLAARGDVLPPSKRAPDRTIPPDLEALAMAALRPRPADRLHSVRVLIEGVQDYLTGASARRESDALTRQSEKLLESLGEWGLKVSVQRGTIDCNGAPLAVDSIYTVLTECRGKLDRALGLWRGNPALQGLRDLAQASWARAAIATGDLRLARHVLAEIRSTSLREPLGAELDEAAARLESQVRTRRVSFGLVVALIVLLFAGAIKYITDQRAAALSIARERDTATAALAIAEMEERRAGQSLRLAEREQYFATISFVESCIREGRLEKARDLLLGHTPPHLRNWEWGHLLARCMGERILLYDTDEETDALHVEWSPDGRTVYTGDRLGRVCAWDASTGKLLRFARLHGNGVWNIAVSPDGRTLLTCSFDSTGAIVDAESLAVRHRLEGHGAILRGGTFTADGKRAITCSRDRTLRFWDVASGEQLATVSDFPAGTYDVLNSPDGATVAVAVGKVVDIRDAADGRLLRRSAEHPESVLAAAFSPDGSRIATACTDRKIRLFRTADLEQILEIDNVTSWLQSIAWAPDGSAIAAGDNSGFVRFWNPEDGKRIASFAARPHIFKIRFSPDGRHFATAASRAVQIWDADRLWFETGILRVAPDPSVAEVPSASFGVYAAPLESDSAWRGYDVQFRPASQPGGRAKIPHEGRLHAIDSYYVAIAPDESVRVEIEKDTLIAALVDGRSGKTIKALSKDQIYHAEWSPVGDTFVTGFVNGDVMVWDAATCSPAGVVGERVPLQKGATPRMLGNFAYSPDGRQLLVVRHTGAVETFDVATRRRILSFGPHDGPMYSAAWSRDGGHIAAGGLNARARIWDARTGAHVSTLRGHGDVVMAIAFHPTEDRVLTAGHDDEAKLWEKSTGREIMTVFAMPGQDFLLGADFSPEGRHAYAASSYGVAEFAYSIPWNQDDWPGDDDDDPELRLQLEVRRARTGLPIQPSDVCMSLEAAEAAASD